MGITEAVGAGCWQSVMGFGVISRSNNQPGVSGQIMYLV